MFKIFVAAENSLSFSSLLPSIPRRRTARDVLSIRALFTIQILRQIVEIPQNPSSLASSLALRRIDGDFVAGKKLLVFLATLTNGAFSRPSEDHLGKLAKKTLEEECHSFFPSPPRRRRLLDGCVSSFNSLFCLFPFSLTTAADPKVGGM